MSAATYPAHLEARLEQPLSRWLWLAKWWLLALPHYLIVAVFLGGAWWSTSEHVEAGTAHWVSSSGSASWPGLIALMTGRYPPFRLDMGEHEPAVRDA